MNDKRQQLKRVECGTLASRSDGEERGPPLRLSAASRARTSSGAEMRVFG